MHVQQGANHEDELQAGSVRCRSARILVDILSMLTCNVYSILLRGMFRCMYGSGHATEGVWHTQQMFQRPASEPSCCWQGAWCLE